VRFVAGLVPLILDNKGLGELRQRVVITMMSNKSALELLRQRRMLNSQGAQREHSHLLQRQTLQALPAMPIADQELGEVGIAERMTFTRSRNFFLRSSVTFCLMIIPKI